MTIKVKASRVGISPSKVRGVIDLVRNKKASEALKILRFCEKKEISIMLTKLINSGLAIASEGEKYDLKIIRLKLNCKIVLVALTNHLLKKYPTYLSFF